MIPKIIHRIIPRQTTELMDICWEVAKFHHKDWEHVTHYDDGQYDEINDLLKKNIPGAIKADLIRYVILRDFGGVYIDSDFQAYRSLEPLLNNKVFVGYESPPIINQAVIGSIANHKSISLGLDILKHVIRNDLMDSEFLVYDDVLNIKIAPGPYSATKAMTNDSDVLKLNQKAFYPYIPWNSHRPYSESFKDDPEIYGIHWFVKSWGKKHWTLPDHISKLSESKKE